MFSDTKITPEEFGSIGEGQRVNRIPHLSQLLLKKPLAQLLNAAGTDVGVASWCLPEDREVLRGMLDSTATQPFIVKPNGESGGSGISIHRGLASVLPLDDAIVQPLLEDPLLFEGRKADFRVFAVVLNGRGADYRVFLLKQGYARVASAPFVSVSSGGALGQHTVHLTNDSVNRGQAALETLVRPVDQVVPPHLTGQFQQLVGELVRRTMAAVMAAVKQLPPAPVAPEHTYQVLGFDVFASARLDRVALLEVNSKPCLGCDLDQSAVLREVCSGAAGASLLLGGAAGDDEAIERAAQQLRHLVVQL